MWGALIGAGISILGNTIGGALGNKRKREAEEAYQEGINREIEAIDQELNSDYLDSAEARNALRKLTNANKETLRQLNTDAVRGGATEEAKVAMASKLNQGAADVMGDLAAVGERKKEGLRQQKRSIRLGKLQHQYAIDSDTSGIDNITKTISDAANSLGTAWGGRSKDVSPEVTNGKGKSSAVSPKVLDGVPTFEDIRKEISKTQLPYGSYKGM